MLFLQMVSDYILSCSYNVFFNFSFDEHTSIIESTEMNTVAPQNTSKKEQKNERPHICSQCSKAFKWAAHLREHVQCVHEKIRHQCNLCPQSFTLERKLRKHLINKHCPKS